MRRILAPVLISILLTVSCFGISSELARTQRHRASHWIIALHYDDDGTRHAAGCSATAIGPHTLLTAAHCYVPNETLFIDASIDAVKAKAATEYHPTNFIFDLQDHMLIDVPGAHFTTYIPLANFRAPRQGEHFYFYGNPAGIQDQYREGYITGQVHMNPDDGGDVVAGSTMYMATGPVVGGDSGSSLYALDGTLIGIVTFGIEDGKFLGTFPIEFTAGQIAESLQSVVTVDQPAPRPPDTQGAPNMFRISFSHHTGGSRGQGGGHSSPRPPARGPGGYHGNPNVKQHYHNGRFDHDYYIAHFGVYHPFYIGGLFWYGPAFAYESVFVFDDCGFMLSQDLPGEWQPEAVYIVEVNGLYYVASPNMPGLISVQVIF